MNDIKGRVEQGIPLSDELVIDAHCHMGRWFNFNIPANTAADMVAQMDRLGIRACIAAHHSSIGPDFRYGNDEVLRAIEEFPGRIYGYATVNPHYGDEELTDELERCISAGMVGIKIHPDLHQYPADGPKYTCVWEFANDHCLPLLCHTTTGGYNGVNMFRALAEKYPNMKIILGHSGFGSEGADQAIQAVLEHPNIYMDIAQSTIMYGTLERMVRQGGAERVLFGSDMPFLDPRPQIGRVACAKISDDEKRLVFGLNASKVFRIK